jgi:PEP-CTERM motif
MNVSKVVLPGIALLSLLQWSDSIQAATVSIHPTADTTLQEAYPTYNYGDGTSFTAGGRRQGGRTRALLLFDISGNVPAGSMINSVTLTLSCVQAPSGGVNSTFDLNRLLASWGEGNGSDHGGSPAGAGQATWINRFGSSGSPWSTSGGDFISTASASRSIAGFGSYTFSSTAGLVADVQGWLNSPASDFGWILRSESEVTGTTIRRFGSRDSGATAPTLTISFTPIPEPATFSILGLGLVVFLGRQRRTAFRASTF